VSTTPPTEAGPLLERHRRDIETLDRRILHLVRERLDLARAVGEIKARAAIPLRDFGVEAEVHKRFREEGQRLGLDTSLTHDLARFLIDRAVEHQAVQRDAAYAGDALDSVVIGGKGGMGGWFARLLAGQGHRVRVQDPAPGPSDFTEATDSDAAVADLVLVAVPMSACAEVLERLALSRPRGVVAEICSLKGHLGPTLSRLRDHGMRLVSLHPMFGPAARTLEGRTIVICDDAAAADVAVVTRLFEETSARLVSLDPVEHDRRMALVLGLTHLVNLAYARALALAGAGPRALHEVAGVTFSRQLATTREVASESPDLYYEIQALNAHTAEAAASLREALGDWLGALAAGDRPRFVSMMLQARDVLDAPETSSPA
jgi:chorismate mutase/prephenate dehydrogenase